MDDNGVDKRRTFDDFRELLHSLAQEEINNILKNNNIYKSHVGQIIAKNNEQYDVDIFDTILHNIQNKSNQSLSIGDSVTVFEQYGSNYQNCFIMIKNNS